MQRFVGSIAILGQFVAPPPAASQPTTAGMVQESESGTPFPVVLTPPDGKTEHRLVGTGIRQRTVFRVNVYAFGLYVDPAGAETALAEFAGLPAAALQRDARFQRRLLDLDFGMTLRLVMTRTVGGGDVADAFDDALRRRLPRSKGEGHTPDAADALARLRNYLDVDEVVRGAEIIFSCDPVGLLALSMGDTRRPPIASPALCRALFDVYLGKDPIARDGKRNIVAGFASLLAGTPHRR